MTTADMTTCLSEIVDTDPSMLEGLFGGLGIDEYPPQELISALSQVAEKMMDNGWNGAMTRWPVGRRPMLTRRGSLPLQRRNLNMMQPRFGRGGTVRNLADKQEELDSRVGRIEAAVGELGDPDRETDESDNDYHSRRRRPSLGRRYW